jgi:hypothetical protein
MDVHKILEELRKERDQIEEAIQTLERLAQNRGKRRGRPPGWMKPGSKKESLVVENGAAPVKKKRGRPRKNPV